MSTSTTNLGLVKPDGPDRALVAVINENMNKIDQYAGEVNDSLGAIEDGMAIVANGNTHAAITSGQFVYVRNHSTLTQGLYTATANIAANATLSTSNLTADPSGGLNALNSKLTMETVTINRDTTKTTAGVLQCVVKSGWCYVYIGGLVFSQSGYSQMGIITNLPKCAKACVGTFVGNDPSKQQMLNNSGDMWWVNENATTLNVHIGSAYSEAHSVAFSYPVVE